MLVCRPIRAIAYGCAYERTARSDLMLLPDFPDISCPRACALLLVLFFGQQSDGEQTTWLRLGERGREGIGRGGQD